MVAGEGGDETCREDSFPCRMGLVGSMIRGMYQHPNVPWVSIQPLQDGSAVVTNTRTGERIRATSDRQVHEFAASAARAPGHYGAGDAVAAAASRMGFQKCAPCAQRQARLNAMLPNVWRR